VASGFYTSQAWEWHAVNLTHAPVPRLGDGITQRYVPFADAASSELPLGRLLRLSLFQLSIGMTMALLVGTLNRVMIVELGVPAWWVALSVALPLVFAPLRALIGYRSDTHPSALGLRRMPYMWIGTLLMFGGLAIMPFALLLLSLPADATGVDRSGPAASARRWPSCWWARACRSRRPPAWRWPATSRPPTSARVWWRCSTACCWLGMILGSGLLGWVLTDFSPTRLVQVVQGAAVLVALLNMASLWKQEARGARRGAACAGRRLLRSWARLMAIPRRSGVSSGPWAWAPWPSACRTWCSNPSAGRCWAWT
jgi:MFS transporter, BCD family, chlorophyll transporter